jgi:AraC-like DNA-binding protein
MTRKSGPAATVLASWARAIKRALDAAGCDSAAVFRKAGLDPAVLADPNARYPVENTTRLWQLAVAATGDACFGLKVASQVNQTTFHALGYALTASTTLKDVFERSVRYFRVVTDAVDLDFRASGAEYHFRILPPESGPQPAHEAVDAFISVYVRTCRALTDRSFAPLRILLRRPAPPDPAGFERTLRAPLRFAAAENLLVLDRAALERPLEGANPELARHNDEIVLRYLARFDRDNILARVKAALVECLPHGEPSQDAIAAALHLSSRSLQRRLADENTSYKQLLDATRRELALSYLKDNRYSVSEITYVLGFSDLSSFTRAFRRWTGQPPSAWRAGAGD